MTEHIASLLDVMAELQDNRIEFETEKQAAQDKVLTEEIRAELSGIDANFAPALARLDEKIASLRSDVERLTLAEGKSVKGTRLYAIYSRGRVTWDGKGLEGFSVAHPEIGAFRKVGEPSVSFRKA